MVSRAGIVLLFMANITAPPALSAPESVGQGRDLLLEAQVEPAQVYVQSQAIYRLRFYQAIDVRELKIAAPPVQLADMRPIGAGRIFEALRDGRRYRVHERSYAVFPFASGTLQLAGANATGRIAAPVTKSADGRRAVRLEAAAQTLTVLPAPETAVIAPWLPAKSLTLTETWPPALGETRVGDSQRRTIRIEAAGVDAGQLPELPIEAAGMAVHAEPARLENRFAGETNIGVREQTFKMVALRSGRNAVHEVQLRWWNVGSHMPAIATLPSRTVEVAGNDAAPDVAASAAPAATAARSSYLLRIIAGVLGATAMLAYWKRADARATWRLRRACRSGDARAVRDALLTLAAKRWPDTPPPTLEALAARLHDPMARRALGELERSLYGPARGNGDVRSLIAAVRHVKRDVSRSKSAERQRRRKKMGR